MWLRLTFVLLAVIASLAFAPAPFPKAQRHGQTEITLESFQGRWRVAKMQITTSTGQLSPHRASFTHVRVVQERWTFINAGQDGVNLSIAFDYANKPPLLTLYGWPDKSRGIDGVALIRRFGNGVQIAYRWGAEANRPRSFDYLPTGLWVVTLERD